VPGPLDVAKAVSAATFGAVSVLRGGRSLHPNGMAFEAAFEVDPQRPGLEGVPLFRRRRTLRALVRLSRGAGVPEPFPDVYGLGLRILDAHGSDRHQDLLFATGSAHALGRHLLLPARGWSGRTMSTILPYRVGARRCVLLARADPEPRHPGGLHALADVARATAERTLTISLDVAPMVAGRPLRLGRVLVEDPLSHEAEHELRFSIDNTGGRIAPIGRLNALRPDTYRASQVARHREWPRSSAAERRAERVAA
jgi:hypothetical protein